MSLALALGLDNQMVIGFSGTQQGMTFAQRDSLTKSLAHYYHTSSRVSFHHGDCIGADLEAALIARSLGFPLVSHPSDLPPAKRAFVKSEITHKPRPPLKRNMDIALAADVLFIAPKEVNEQLRSGTWSTYRYGTQLRRHVVIILPDGQLTQRTW